MNRCLEPLKAEPQEMFGGSNIYSPGIWIPRVRLQRALEGTGALVGWWNLPVGRKTWGIGGEFSEINPVVYGAPFLRFIYGDFWLRS